MNVCVVTDKKAVSRLRGMGCTSSAPLPSVPAASALDAKPSLLGAAVPQDPVAVEAAAPPFTRTILNHSRVFEDEYTQGKQLGKCVGLGACICCSPVVFTGHFRPWVSLVRNKAGGVRGRVVLT